MFWIAWRSLTHPWYNIKTTLDYIQTQFSGLFSPFKINVIITCKCRTTLECLIYIMLPFDLASCLSVDVKHSYKLGDFFLCGYNTAYLDFRKCNIVELELNGFSLFGNLKWIKCLKPIGLDDFDFILISVSFVFMEHTQLYLSIILKFDCMQF